MDIESVSKNKNEIVYHSLLEEIRNGLLPAGTRLPSERELADQYACSRITVRSALEKLGKKQVIRRIQGNGTFVNGIDTIASNDFRVGLILDAEEDELYNDPWLSELLYGMISAGRKQPFTISVIPVAGKEDIVISLRNRGQSLHDYNGFIAARNLSEDVRTAPERNTETHPLLCCHRQCQGRLSGGMPSAGDRLPACLFHAAERFPSVFRPDQRISKSPARIRKTRRSGKFHPPRHKR